ncbi:MAG: hypothetical protein QM781_07825 [Chitinophagaceae bacterium]
MASQPIPVAQANAMIAQYLAYMNSLGVDMKTQTHCICYDSAAFSKWINAVQPYADEFRICEGVYPEGFVQAGHLTAIIWPYKDGKPAVIPKDINLGGGLQDPDGTINPFNDGKTLP